MKGSLETVQSRFWRGEFGDAYTERNAATDDRLAARIAMWARILRAMEGAPPRSILEIGANVGINLQALGFLTDATLHAIEPNAGARAAIVENGILPPARVHDGVAAEIGMSDGAVDMAFTSGVLIHVHPDDLLASCREIHRVARRYVVCAEYFSDQPDEVEYRGHAGYLFKRDFGSFWLDNFADLRVLDYGFLWRRLTGLDNITWWVFEKK